MIRDVTSADFERAVLKAAGPILVEFHTDWCRTCRAMESVLEALQKAVGARAGVCRVNAEEEADLSARFDILGVPTFIIFRDGEPATRLEGGQTLKSLQTELRRAGAPISGRGR